MGVPATLIPWEQWQEALFAWAATAGIPVIWAGQSDNPVTPPRPYVSLQVLNLNKLGFDGMRTRAAQKNGDGAVTAVTESYYGERELALSVQVYAFETGNLDESAVSYCESLRNSLEFGPVWQALATAGLGLIDYSEVRNLAEAFGQQMGGRAGFEVSFEGAAALDGGAEFPTVGSVAVELDTVLENGSTQVTNFVVTGEQ